MLQIPLTCLEIKGTITIILCLAKVDTDGNPEWVIGFGGDNTSGGCPYPIYDADDHSYDVKVDGDGFIYVTGFFSGYDADFDGFTITNPEWGNDCQTYGLYW